VTNYLLLNVQFLGMFTKLCKTTVSFIMCVCPSSHLHGTTGFHWMYFHEILYVIMSQKVSSTTSFWKLCHLWDNVEKYGTRRQITDDYKMAHVLCLLDKYGYKHTFRICYTGCLSTAIMLCKHIWMLRICLHCLYFWIKCCMTEHLYILEER
jgi:hypothetical protein